ncbi:hypothetical protein [Thermospira aquatica]|uniref:Thioredoxin family protein n=1 Tax=Thermospira aquatica TaxID=2828656 RepID=A0AAX3BEL9_9SPIR|nr:hypothetical protein [Thermospira aquatica]URA10699.1 hypothetical protein KDW03_02535 [Thermospira aquatica]
MLRIHPLPQNEVYHALEHREFSPAITSGPSAVVLSQDWCPDWLAMEKWLEAWKDSKRVEQEIDIYIYLYNREPEFVRFLALKENVWNNYLIPYVRYYCGNHLIAESNYVTPEGFLKRFENERCTQLKENV